MRSLAVDVADDGFRHVGSIVRQHPDPRMARMTGERCAHHETSPVRHLEGRNVEFVGAGYGVQTSVGFEFPSGVNRFAVAGHNVDRQRVGTAAGFRQNHRDACRWIRRVQPGYIDVPCAEQKMIPTGKGRRRGNQQ